MKKTLLVITVMLATIGLQAQVEKTTVESTKTAPEKKLRWGIKAGSNLSSLGEFEYQLAPGEDADLQHAFGIYAGLFTQLYLTKNWGLETGLYFSQQGGRDRDRDFDENYKVKASGSYLQIPISVFYRLPLTRKISIYPSVGVYGAYGLSGKIKSEGQVHNNDITSEQQYFSDFANRFDFGGTAGLQVEFGKLLVGAAFDHGITRVNKQKVNFEDNAYNSNLRLTIGLLF